MSAPSDDGSARRGMPECLECCLFLHWDRSIALSLVIHHACRRLDSFFFLFFFVGVWWQPSQFSLCPIRGHYEMIGSRGCRLILAYSPFTVYRSLCVSLSLALCKCGGIVQGQSISTSPFTILRQCVCHRYLCIDIHSSVYKR